MQDEGLLSKITRSFSVELPESDSMDEYLDHILPLIRPWSEDLYEEEYYLNVRWKEVRDDENFHDSILHIFRPKGEYMYVKDGDITNGRWKTLPNSNTIILESDRKSELYDMAFMNNDFFVLRKHGDQTRKGMRKYFVMGREEYISRWDWREMMEVMFGLFQNNSNVIIYVAVLVVIVAGIVIFSLF